MVRNAKSKRLSAAMLFGFMIMLIAVGSMVSGANPRQGMPGMNTSPIQTGYAVVTPTSAATGGLVVFATFGQRQGNQMTQAGVLPAALSTHFTIFVSTSGRLSRDLGVAVANPNSTAANVILNLRDDMGQSLGSKTVQVDAKNQSAEFVSQLFDTHQAVSQDLTGMLDISSDVPVAVMGLRFRGANFSTLPATSLSPASAVPIINPGVGGPAAVVLPQFATGGGWATEIVLANTGAADIVVRVDLFAQNGEPLTASLNGLSQSSFLDIAIPKGGVVVLAPLGANGDDGF